jgi:hypothetical protein
VTGTVDGHGVQIWLAVAIRDEVQDIAARRSFRTLIERFGIGDRGERAAGGGYRHDPAGCDVRECFAGIFGRRLSAV